MNQTTSIIVPVYNDPKGIDRTLGALCEQTFEFYEIIPVDNDSTDETPEIIDWYADQYPSIVRPRKEAEIQSSYAARNTGIDHANGDLLVFIDADMYVEETWLERIAEHFRTTDCDYLGHNVRLEISDEPSIWERYERALAFPIEAYLERERYAPTCALAVRRSVVDAVGAFDHRLESGGDKEFGRRVHEHGFEQCYSDEIVAYHPARETFVALSSKALRVGRGLEQLRQRHPHIANNRHPFHPFRYLPPSPRRLYEQFAAESAVLLEIVTFGIIEYLLKLYQTKGSIDEYRSRSEK